MDDLDPGRLVIWVTDDGETTYVFDLDRNRPLDLDDTARDRAVARLRATGAEVSTDYPGRACSLG